MNRKLITLVALILCAAMLLMVSGCTKAPAEAPKADEPTTDEPAADAPADEPSAEPAGDLDYANMTEQDLIDALISDPAHITEDEYLALLNTLSYVQITDSLELEENITQKAIWQLRDEDAEFPSSDNIIKAMLASEAPQVRGFAMGMTFSLFGTSDDAMKAIMDVVANETEPYVLKCAVSALSNDGLKDAAIGKFLVDMSKHENARVRQQAVYALGNTWSIGVDGAVEALLDAMNDSDPDVRKAAYKYSGKQHDDRVLEPIKAMLADMSLAEYHASGLDGLTEMWFNYPFHEHTNEEAYKIAMDYLKNVERTEDTPPWIAISGMQYISDQNFDEWKANATYYNVDEFVAVMEDIVKSGDVDWLARVAAMDVICAHGTDKHVEELGKIVEGLTDDKADLVKNAYEDDIKE